MKKRYMRWLAFLLAAAMLLSACGTPEPAGEKSLRDHLNRERYSREETQGPESGTGALTFSQMPYSRPDMQALEDLLDAACVAAAGTDADAILEAVEEYYDAYDWFYTLYFLADIRYSMDLTDAYWEEEYHFCMEAAATVDSGLESLYYALAGSSCREELETAHFGEGFFDAYEGENNWDEGYTALLNREAELEALYYAVSGDALELSGTALYDSYGEELAQILVDLIAVRQEMAAYWDYDSYVEFAWDFHYYRDYTPEQMENYLAAISRELVPLYRELASRDVWDYSWQYSSQEDTESFVREAAREMGGAVWEAYRLMEQRELYEIGYSPNKYSSAFEVWLLSYAVPFVYMCPEQRVYDWLTFAHEFGHFANDYASEGSVAGIDVLEVFSQAMEFLCLCYGREDPDLVRLKMADSLSTYVEQSAFAAFEHRAYSLTGDALSVEGLYALYESVALEFGFDAVGYDPREFVTISHFYTEPVYIDSYVVSNDAALQIYLMELEASGSGLGCFMDTLDTQQEYFLAYLEEAGLESPFAPGQLERVRDLMRQLLLE